VSVEIPAFINKMLAAPEESTTSRSGQPPHSLVLKNAGESVEAVQSLPAINRH
jgi:hypothetical protein